MKIAHIIAIASAESGVSAAAILGRSRIPKIAHARQCAMVAAHRTGLFSSAQIGRVFRRDHSTILHAIKAIERRADPDEADLIDTIALKARITPVFRSSRLRPPPATHRNDPTCSALS